jgi:hypothetical protein
MPVDYDYDATRAAIAIMTAWVTDDGSSEHGAAETADEYLSGSGMDTGQLLQGFVHLTGLLLTMRQEQDDVQPALTLRDLATRPWNRRH